MNESVPMTREGYDRLKAEVARLESEEMPRIAEKLAEARAEGDLKENAEYHAQRENQGMLMAKINQIKSKLANATIIDTSTLPKDVVSFGASVLVKDLEFGDEETFTLVGSGDEDYQTGKILLTSPIGQGLLGKKIGEIAEVNAPAGLLKFEVLAISFE
jgi:transcription elongation factor GreA